MLFLHLFGLLFSLFRLTAAPAGDPPDDDADETDAAKLKDTLRKVRKERNEYERETKNLRQFKQDREQADQSERERKAREAGEFQTLIAQRDAEILELKPRAEQVDRYAKRLHERVDAEIKDWPKELKDLVPDATTDPDARETQVERLRPLVERLQAPRSAATSPGPRGTGAQTTAPGPSLDAIKNDIRAQIGGL